MKNISTISFWSLLGANLRQIITGQAQGAEGAAEGDDPVVREPVAGMVSVRGTSVQQSRSRAYIDEVLTRAKRQVLIEVTVVEVELSDQYQAGVDWATRVVQRRTRQRRRVVLISEMIGGNLRCPPVFTMTYNNFDADGSGFSATVKLLAQFGDTKVLSTPADHGAQQPDGPAQGGGRAGVLHAHPETIESTGHNIPLRTIVTSEIKTVPVGFVMSVTPQIARTATSA